MAEDETTKAKTDPEQKTTSRRNYRTIVSPRDKNRTPSSSETLLCIVIVNVKYITPGFNNNFFISEKTYNHCLTWYVQETVNIVFKDVIALFCPWSDVNHYKERQRPPVRKIGIEIRTRK